MKIHLSITTLYNKLFGILFVTFLLLGITGVAQKNEIYLGESVIIHSDILNEDRKLLISLPENYQTNHNKYPVLYVLDGNTHFQHASAAASYLAAYGFVPDIIVVAIVNVDRNRDFTPILIDDFDTEGGALKFHNFITKEVIPFIADNYHSSGFRILMGHSLGGTFIGYSLLEHPDVFNSYIAASPYLQYANDYIVNEAKLKLKKKYKIPKSFFMSIGNEPDYYPVLDKFSQLIQTNSNKSIDFIYVEMKDDNHSTTPYISLFNGLRFTFSDWLIPRNVYEKGLVAIDKHFAKLSEKYEYEITISENTINLMGYEFLRNGETKNAINIFIENTKRFPNSANVYDSLGEAYENDNQFEMAYNNYQKACKLAKEQYLNTLSVFEKNLKRVKNQINK